MSTGSQKTSGKKKFFTLSKMRGTLLIIGVNVAVFLYLNRPGAGTALADSLILSPYTFFRVGHIYALITSGFLHSNVTHLLFNSIGILIFGSIVEKRFGAMKTVWIYFGALVLSMFFSLIIYTFFLHKNVALIGASGAVMGLVSCAMLSDPFLITYETLLPIPVMIKGWMFIYADIKGFMGGETDGVSHLGHLLGFLSIAVMMYFLGPGDKKRLLKGLAVNVVSFGVFLILSNYFAKH